MASSQSFSMIQRRMLLSPEPASPVNSGEPLKTIARREPLGLHLADHVLQEEERAVVDARQAGAEAAVVAEALGLVADEALLRLPLHAEGRVGKQVVEARAGVAVGGEAVAEGDVLEVLALHHQVAAADGVGLGVVLLAVALEARLRVELAQVVLGDGEHAAGAAGGVAEGAHDAGLGERLAVGLEEEVDHQADDLARREVVAGRLVGGLAELPDQLLEDVAHLDVAHRVGVQVDLGELLDHQVEAVGLVELLDLGLEAEVLDDLARARAEAGDVVLQVGRDVGGVVGELGEVEAAGVVEGLLGDVVEDRLEVLDWPPLRLSYLASTSALVGSRTQSRRRRTVSGRITLPYWAGL